MKKHIEVVPYNEDWPKQFESEAREIKLALKDYCVAIHHVGSTAVPGLPAKPKIDIITVVKKPEECTALLEQAGYTYNGEWNVPFKYGFTKRGKVQVNLHVFEEGHSDIELNLIFRDYLLSHKLAIEEYAKLKIHLLKEDEAHQKQKDQMFRGYTLGKDAFIRKILEKAGFNALRFTHCVHHYEWEGYHRIAQAEIFDPVHVEYDRNHPTLKAENHFHFVLSKGIKVIATAHVEFIDKNTAAIRILATDKGYQRQGFGSYMLGLLEKWIKVHGRNTIKMHARLNAEGFYRKLGYNEMLFDDPSISDDIIDLGKNV